MFAVWLANDSASVPLVVTGDPLTVNNAAGAESPTLVTVPVGHVPVKTFPDPSSQAQAV